LTNENLNLANIISEEIIINRDIDWLFDFTQNFSERKKWDKQTEEIEFFADSTKLEKGAKVYTKSIEGIKMETEYLTFNPPTEISIKMLNKSSIFKSFIGTWYYCESEKGRTTLRITYQFNLRFPYNLVKNKVRKKIRINMTKKLFFLEAYLDQIENKNVLQH
jgi:hypothetical protein